MTLDPKALDPKALDPKALDPKALDPKALDAAVKIVASAMAQANGADPQGIDQDNLAGWELFATDARVALDRALPAILAAAERRGAEAMRERAAAVCLAVKADRYMNHIQTVAFQMRTAAAIRALPTEPTP